MIAFLKKLGILEFSHSEITEIRGLQNLRPLN